MAEEPCNFGQEIVRGIDRRDSPDPLRPMHSQFHKADSLTKNVIGAAIEVHRDKGPGLLESIYENCLIHELRLRGVSGTSQKQVQIRYKDLLLSETMRFDLLIEDVLLIEAKAVERILPIHKAQLLSYMKLMDVPIGLLINFHELILIQGVTRLILPGANLP